MRVLLTHGLNLKENNNNKLKNEINYENNKTYNDGISGICSII